MTDKQPKSTLVLKKQAESTDGTKTEPRRRSGARAHAARQRHHEKQQQKRIQKRAKKSTFKGSEPTRHRRRSPVAAKSVGLRDDSQIYTVFAPCPAGLEPALFDELKKLGYSNIEQARAGCRFTSDWYGIMRANLYSRLATRILVQVAKSYIRTEKDILELARETEWEQWFGPEHTLRLDISAIRSPMQSLQYCNLLAKDGICDRLMEIEGDRPNIDTVRPDARVQVFLDENTATLYLDTTGESLFKRGWRMDKGSAPIRENLAAGLLSLSGWDAKSPLLDPFCGSGTILIEAAWMALDKAPGINRPFGFQRMRDHNGKQWQELKAEAQSLIKETLDFPITGFDINAEALESARNNIQSAGLAENLISLEQSNAVKSPPPSSTPGHIVCNPPYGERMEDDDTMWSEWATNLKQNYAGWDVNVISSNLDLPSKMRLKPKRRFPVYNGALDCRLFKFEIVESTYSG